MTARRIDGTAFAAKLRQQIADHTSRLKTASGITPGLAVILVGEDKASQIYVNSKSKYTKEVGMNSFKHVLPVDTTEEELLNLICKLNHDPAVNGILCQLPLPSHISEHLVINAISAEKDVDGFHAINVGRLTVGQESLVPCTPLGCLLLLRDLHGSLSGKKAVVIGRSNIVGKPIASLLLRDHATVTIVHSRSKDVEAICRQADIIVAAVGQPEIVTSDWVKPGATVIDVGINRLPPKAEGEKGRLVGDVNFAEVSEVAGAITPVPGGVGPMTIACLLANTLTAFCRQNNFPVLKGLTA